VRKLTAILIAVVLVSGCNLDWLPGGPDGDPGIKPETGASSLKTFGSEAELKEYFSDVAENDFRFGFRNELDGAEPLAGEAGDFDDATGDAGGAAPPGAPDSEVSSEIGNTGVVPGFSDTTTQEAGVQEADVIKNDSTYVYVLTSGALRIVKASPGDELADIGSVALDGWGQDLYRLPETEPVATRIVSITQTDNWFGVETLDAAQAEPAIAPGWYATPQTVVNVIDVSDHANPVVESTSTFDGSLLTSRMIGDKLYLVIAHYPDYYGGFPFAEINDVDIDQILPDYAIQRNADNTTTGNLVTWSEIYRPTDPDGLGMTSIVTLDVNQPAAFQAVAVVAYPGNLYASTKAVYLTDTDYNWQTGGHRETTDIYKFNYTDNSVQLAATGSVSGRVLNQYSLSEYQDYLRIATTISGTWFEDGQRPSVNNLFVLAEQNGSLAVVGSVTNLAPGEEVKSARFIGPRGYLVTFERIDPLFTFDLSNPSNPLQVGELKVTGFSSFIFPMGENHLLTVGEDIDLSEGWPRSNGVQLSIFDISNFANPQLAYKEVIGTAGTYSDALHNPKAMTYYAAEDLLALPIEHYEWVAFDGGPGILEGDTRDESTNGDDESETGEGSSGGTGEEDPVDGDAPPDESTVVAPAIVPGFDGVILVRVDTITAADLDSDDARLVRQGFNERLAQELGTDLEIAFANALQREAGITLDRAVIDAVNAQFP